MAATNRDGTIDTITRAGVVDTLIAIDSTNGDTWTNDGTQWLEIKASAGGSVTASVPYLNTYDGQTIPPKTITVASNARVAWGPFPPEKFGSAPVVTWSGTTASVTFDIRKLGS